MRLIPVDPQNEDHVHTLYDIFMGRAKDARISSKGPRPTYEQHREFVRNHPYVDWSLISAGYPARHPQYEPGFFIVGAISLSQPPRPSVAGDEISVDILPAFQGQGNAAEAIRLMMEKHGPRRYLANIAPENYRSMALFKKLGFRQCQVTFSLEIES